MSMLKLNCGCIWSEKRKCCVHRCRVHLNQQIKNNIEIQNQINAELEQKRSLLLEQEAKTKKSRWKLKPIFDHPKNVFKKKLF